MQEIKQPLAARQAAVLVVEWRRTTLAAINERSHPADCLFHDGGKRLKVISSLHMAAILAVSCIAFPCTAAPKSRAPMGKYCGQLLSSGMMAKVETKFEPAVADDRLMGSYAFVDNGQTVTGLLAEVSDDGDGNVLTRNLLWQDKYGHGSLIVTFTSDFSAFQGKWSTDGKTLFPWIGKRCAQAAS